jgi:hypothetical protein
MRFEIGHGGSDLAEMSAGRTASRLGSKTDLLVALFHVLLPVICRPAAAPVEMLEYQPDQPESEVCLQMFVQLLYSFGSF